MTGRKSIANILPLLVLAISLALVDSYRAARGSEVELPLILRSEKDQETRMSMSEFAKLPRVSVRAKDEKGKESVWEGVALNEALKAAGVNLGEAIRGVALANYLLVEAADGYRVVFTLPELDPAFTNLVFLLADRRDGQPMSEYEGDYES